MIGEFDPIEGNWYCNLDNEQDFEVVDVNEEVGTVDIRYPDGDVEELDLAEWIGMNLEEIESPENRTDSLEK